jgi:L-alanine-DL-glutamate epimerase-like enolase superfamily enzyme
MKITAYRTMTTQHEWSRPVGDVNGVSTGTRTALHVLVLVTDDGIEGIGMTASSLVDVERLFPAVEGEDPRGVTALYDRMLAHVFKTGHQGAVFGAIGAIDQALWDIKAKAAGEPLWRMLGGRSRFVPGYASGLEYGLTDDELHALYERFADVGFSQAKVKGGRVAADDIRRLRIARDVMRRNSEDPAVMFDANESWHRSQAVRHIRRLEEAVDLAWVEEPLRRWDAVGLADLRGSIGAGVASGENLTGLEQYRPLLDADALDVVQFNASWGITHALRVSTVAHARDLPVSPVGLTAVTAAAVTAMPNHLTSEVQDLTQPLGVTIDQHVADGGIVLGDEPGAGIVLDEAAIAGLTPSAGWTRSSGPHVRPARAGLRLVPEDVVRGADPIGARR